MENEVPQKTRRFRIQVDEHHAGGLFELEITIKYFVIDTWKNEVVMQLISETSAEMGAGQWTNYSSGGVSEVRISDDEMFVLVSHYGSEVVEQIPLVV
jgi:hypothetical protein